MKRLFQKDLNSFTTTLLFSLLLFGGTTQLVEAQIKLPKLFNRDKPDKPAEPRRNPRLPIIPNRRNSDNLDNLVVTDSRPTPNPVRINALKGYESTFSLSSRTNIQGKTVEYIIRDFPSAGKIVGILSNRNDRSTASITYYADPNSAETKDSFTFAARYPGGKLSTPVRCDIQIKDASASIEVTSPNVDFGKVMLGETVIKEIFITNRGKAPYISNLNVSSPWKVVYPASAQLAIPGESRTSIKVAFTPTTSGDASFTLPFGSGLKGKCLLRGTVIAPVTFKQETWDMTINPKTRDREVSIVVTNNSIAPATVALRASSRLTIEGGRTAILPPGKESIIQVKLPATDVRPIDGGLEIKMQEGYSQVTKIKSPTVPAKLHIEIPGQLVQDVINFGRVNAGRSLEKNIILKNLGGEIIAIDGAVEEPFRILSRVDRQLAPQESLAVAIGYYPDEKDQGGFDQFAVFAGRNQQVKLRLLGNAIKADSRPYQPRTTQPAERIATSNPSAVKQPPPTTIPTPIPETRKVEQDLAEEPEPEPLTPVKIVRKIANDLDSPEDLHLIKTTPKSVEISWTAPRDADIDTFEIEIRSPQTANRSWSTHANVELKQIDRLVKAKIIDLDPKTGYEFQVFTIDTRGHSSVPSAVIASETTSSKTWIYIALAALLLTLGCFAWVFFKFIQKPKPSDYEELLSEYIE